MSKIDPRLKKIIALWRRTEHDGERQAARARAEELCERLGVKFEDAVSRDEADRSSGGQVNPFAGFDDFMEAREPGYKAQQAQKAKEKAAARAARAKALIDRYGSKEAALAPCERERLLLAAVAKWRTPQKPPHDRWTHDVDGWQSAWKPAPPHVDAAIRSAYPLSETFAEAQAEAEYWRQRDRDMGDLLDDQYGDYALDMVAEARLQIIQRLIDADLVVRTPADLLVRFRSFNDRECVLDGDDQEKLLSDLEGIVAANEAYLSNVGNGHIETPSRPSKMSGRIEGALRADPARSDRAIARELGCSPTSVGKVRSAIGLAGEPRSVQRRGQIFSASYQRSRHRRSG